MNAKEKIVRTVTALQWGRWAFLLALVLSFGGCIAGGLQNETASIAWFLLFPSVLLCLVVYGVFVEPAAAQRLTCPMCNAVLFHAVRLLRRRELRSLSACPFCAASLEQNDTSLAPAGRMSTPTSASLESLPGSSMVGKSITTILCLVSICVSVLPLLATILLVSEEDIVRQYDEFGAALPPVAAFFVHNMSLSSILVLGLAVSACLLLGAVTIRTHSGRVLFLLCVLVGWQTLMSVAFFGRGLAFFKMGEVVSGGPVEVPPSKPASTLLTAINMFTVDHGRPPDTLTELFVAEPDDTAWDGPYLSVSNALLDVWGQALRYKRNANTFRLVSAGPDGIFETKDDIGSFAIPNQAAAPKP